MRWPAAQFHISRNRAAGRRPATLFQHLKKSRCHETNFFSFHQKLCEKSKIRSVKVVTNGFSSFWSTTVHNFSSFPQRKANFSGCDFRRVAGRRPAALNQNLTKFAFQGLENPESMHCAALKMGKYHYLQLYITRFWFLCIFFDQNWENWFLEIKNFFEVAGRRPADGRPPCFVKYEIGRPADGRPPQKNPTQNFFDKKLIFAKKIAEIIVFMHPKCVFSIFQMICEVREAYLMLKSMFLKFPSAVLCWVPLFQKWL